MTKPSQTWLQRVAPEYIATAMNSCFLIFHTAMFLSSITTLWGWTFIGLGSCLGMIAALIDDRFIVSRIVFIGVSADRAAERYAQIYRVGLVIAAVLINVGYFLYKLGMYLFGPPTLVM